MDGYTWKSLPVKNTSDKCNHNNNNKMTSTAADCALPVSGWSADVRLDCSVPNVRSAHLQQLAASSCLDFNVNWYVHLCWARCVVWVKVCVSK